MLRKLLWLMNGTGLLSALPSAPKTLRHQGTPRKRRLRPEGSSPKGSWCLGVFVAMCLGGTVDDVLGLSEYTLGQGGVSWEEMVSPEEEEVYLIDFQRDPGAIQPLLTDSTWNLMRGAEERGGFVVSLYTQSWYSSRAIELATRVPTLFDGEAEDLESVLVWHALPQTGTNAAYYVNLGGQFRVAKVRLYPRVLEPGDPAKFPEGYVFSDEYLTEYHLFMNDGTPQTKHPQQRYPLWTLIREETEHFEPYIEVKLDPPNLIQYLYLRPGRWLTDWQIGEWEVYGGGYVPSATYTSKIIDTEGLSSWGNIRWSGVNVYDPKAKLMIQTRTGSDPDPVVYWRKTGYADDEIPFDETGRYYTKSDYEGFPLAERGRTTYDTERWSYWSPPYPFEAGLEGTPIVSPGPRRYIQFKIDFLPSLHDGGRLDFISFQVSQPPVARNVTAEIWPGDVTPAVSTDFTYAVRADIRPGDTGFDRLKIRTSVRGTPRAVRIGGEPVEYDVIAVNEQSLTVGFPKITDDRLLEVDFSCQVLMYGTSFDGWVSDSGGHEVAQRVNEGDARSDWGTNRLSVLMSLGKGLIAHIAIRPGLITPNGDGANDAAEIVYELLQLNAATPVHVDVYDLSGAFIRRIYRGEDLNGVYTREWDGKDEEGNLVRPGVYLYTIGVDADAGREMKTGTITVMY